MKELLTYVAQHLVEHPEQVPVTVRPTPTARSFWSCAWHRRTPER